MIVQKVFRKMINSGVLPFPGYSGYMSSTDYKPLYNGNISSMAVNIGQLNQPLLYNYHYDQLNRVVSMDAINGLNQTGNNWIGLSKINDYQECASYDANGNIQTYLPYLAQICSVALVWLGICALKVPMEKRGKRFKLELKEGKNR